MTFVVTSRKQLAICAAPSAWKWGIVGNLLEAPRLLGILAAHRNQTAVKIGGEGLSIFFALALGVVSGMLQDSLDGVLVLLLAFVVSTIRDNHQVGMARLPA